MADFANASHDSAVHTVVLFTDWGSVYSEDKDSIYTKACRHEGYTPGVTLCDYLMEHTSTEFAWANLRRALYCLRTSEALRLARPGADYTHGAVTSRNALYVKPGVSVQVGYVMDDQSAPPSLTISVHRISGH